jgi:hypothetical protein
MAKNIVQIILDYRIIRYSLLGIIIALATSIIFFKTPVDIYGIKLNKKEIPTNTITQKDGTVNANTFNAPATTNTNTYNIGDTNKKLNANQNSSNTQTGNVNIQGNTMIGGNNNTQNNGSK